MLKGSIFIWMGVCLFFVSCREENRKKSYPESANMPEQQVYEPKLPFPVYMDTPVVNDTACFGTYRGVEFIDEQFVSDYDLNGTDIAHQYSNKICRYVGDYLKKRFRDSCYLRVSLNHIRMETKGMQDEDNYVEYSVYIPFERCSRSRAMTAFDHCGGWGHKPDLKNRVNKLLNSNPKIVWKGHLDISKLYRTPEGLQEYWIQWVHSDFR